VPLIWFWAVGRQTAPYSPEHEPDIILIEAQPRHWVAELIVFSTS
jgi:hypothetical protein